MSSKQVAESFNWSAGSVSGVSQRGQSAGAVSGCSGLEMDRTDGVSR